VKCEGEDVALCVSHPQDSLRPFACRGSWCPVERLDEVHLIAGGREKRRGEKERGVNASVKSHCASLNARKGTWDSEERVWWGGDET
jgi:hypothetical protein